jgi:hypothetical protein
MPRCADAVERRYGRKEEGEGVIPKIEAVAPISPGKTSLGTF